MFVRSLAPPTSLEVGACLHLLPGVAPGASNPELRSGTTQPPGRYHGHTLVKAMKDGGIGRPSTYAATVEKLLERKYAVREKDGTLAPTEAGRCVWLTSRHIGESAGQPDCRSSFIAGRRTVIP